MPEHAPPPRIGFIGIGIMGEAMVRRLLDLGHHVVCWNLEPDRLSAVVPYGAVAASSPAEVARACDVVMLCVLNAEAVERCVFAQDGVVAAGRGPAVVVDLSTTDPAATRRFAAMLEEATGAGWIDAPVSGGPQFARDGRMTVMAGGCETDFTRIEPLLRQMAGNVTLMGPVGAGQTTKIINHAIVGTGYIVMAETLILAESAGIDTALIPQCLAGGYADSSLLQRLFPQMSQRAFEPPATYARQMLKDLKAVSAFASDHGVRLDLVEHSRAQFAEFVDSGHDKSDSAAIVDIYRGRARRS